MKIFFIIIGSLLLIAAIVVGGKEANLWLYKTYEPKMEEARRDVYENTNSFVKAKKQEILKAYKEYNKDTTFAGKQAIQEMLSMSLADFDEDSYITDAKLLRWVKQMKY